jgi:chromosomal replication initiation ATPase DnaA
MNIFWISGRCGYGKTAFADSIIKEFEGKNKKTCKLDGKDFIDFLIKNIKIRNPIENFVSRFQNYDLLVLDNIDYVLLNKPATQGAIKEAIEKITDNNKTKVILISQKRARKTRKLKFNSDCCEYIRLKPPSTDFKIKLVEEWLGKEKLAILEEEIKEIVDESNNLFQLKGLFHQICFKYR